MAASSSQRTARGWIWGVDSVKCAILSIARKYSAVGTMESLLWLLLEAGVALGLLLAIVWWTWPRKGPDRDDEANRRR